MRFLCLVGVLCAAAPVRAQDAAETAEETEWTPPEPSASTLRGLPICPPGTEWPEPGEPYTCRPPWGAPSPHWSVLAQLSFGAADAQAPLLGPAGIFEAGLEYWPTRALAIGGRYGYLFAGDEGIDADGDGRDDAETRNLGVHLVGAGPRLTLWTDETARQGWTLSLDGGWAFARRGVIDDGPFARFGLLREAGYADASGHLRTGIGLVALQGFGPTADLRALFFSFALGFGGGVPEPRDLDEPWVPASFEYSFGPEISFLSLHLTDDRELLTFGYLFGFHFGIPVAEWLEPRVRVGMQYQPMPDGQDGVTLYTGSAGAWLGIDRQSSPFVEVMGGYGFAYGTEPRVYDDGPFLDVTVGWQVGGCNAAFDAGLRYRRGLGQDNRELHALFLIFDGSYRSLTARTAVGGCAQGEAPTVPLPPPPPPPPPAPSTEVELEAGGGIELEVPRIEAGAEIEVEIEPVVIEVTLGMWLLGGAVRFEIDPRSLPLAQMREAGLVDIEIRGPAAALARAEAQVQAVLSREGLQVRGFATTAVDSTEVKAIITLFPRQ